MYTKKAIKYPPKKINNGLVKHNFTSSKATGNESNRLKSARTITKSTQSYTTTLPTTPFPTTHPKMTKKTNQNKNFLSLVNTLKVYIDRWHVIKKGIQTT